MTDDGRPARSRGRRRAMAEPFTPSVNQTVAAGGKLTVLSLDDKRRIHQASLTLLSTVGMSEAPKIVQKIIIANGGS
jgi:trimethylamine:corrinoid methyltransferase-like protein